MSTYRKGEAIHFPLRFGKLANFGENEIKEFPTDLAAVGNVATKTQDQALAALLFLYQKVMRRKLAFIDAARSKKPVTLPVVLSR